MGQVADILSSEEWAQKSPLEKASARRDLFELTVNQNPQLQQALSAADPDSKQKIFNDWRVDVETKFPTAFKSKAKNVQRVGSGGFTELEAEAPVYDFKTEAVLSALSPRYEVGKSSEQIEARKSIIDSLSEDQKKAILPFYAQRYGLTGADDFGGIKQLFPEKSGARAVAEVAVPTALRVGPAILASATKNPRLVAGATALGEGMAQSAEQMFGNRAAISPTEIGLSSLLSVIPAATIGKIVNPYMRTAATAGVRAAEGAAQGALFESGRQILEGESDPMRALFTGVAGAGLGGILGGIEGKLAARLAGKSPQAIQNELPDLIKAADTPEAKAQLTEVQRRIEQMLNLDTRELAPASYIGRMDVPESMKKDFSGELYNLTQDTAGTVKNSTVSRETLEGAGFRVPTVPEVPAAQRVDIPLSEVEPTAARSAETFQQALDAPPPAAVDTELAQREMRALDFERARAEEAGQIMRENQLAGDESIITNLPPPNSQITVMQMGPNRVVQVDIPGPPGERPTFSGTAEDAAAAGYDFQLPADLTEGRYTYGQLNPTAYETPQANAQSANQEARRPQEVQRGQQEVAGVSENVDPSIQGIDLSPQAQSIYDTYGFIDPVLQRALASGGGGIAAGAYGLTQGDTPEERIKNGLAYAVLGAGGGYMAGRAFTRLADQRLPSSSKFPGLAKWAKRLGEPESGITLRDKIRNAPNATRAELTTRMAPLDKLPRQIAEANNLPIKNQALPLSRQFENVAGASGKAQIDVEDFVKNALSKVKSDEWQDFNTMLAVKRTGQRLQSDANLVAEQARINAIPENLRTPEEVAILNERPDRRRVAGETLESVDSDLAELRQKLGEKRFNELDQLAAGPFQQEADKALRLLVTSGNISPEMYAAVKESNDFYAPFEVTHRVEEGRPLPFVKANSISGAPKYVYKIEGIDSENFGIKDPAKAMMERIYGARMQAERNLKMKVLADLADEDTSGTVIKKLSPGESAPRGMEAVKYLDQGIPRELAVAPDVAEAIKGLNPASTGIVSRFVRAINRPFRFGATVGNIGFQMVNAPADLLRQATISKYGVGRGEAVADTARYPLDFIHALYSSVLSRPSTSTAAGAVAGFYSGYETGDTAPERFRNAAAGAVLGGLAGRGIQRGVGAGVSALRQAGQTGAANALDPTQLYREFYQSGAAGSTLQDMIENISKDKGRTSITQEVRGPGVINTLQDFGKAIEETTKMLGFKRGLRIEGIEKMSKQKAYDKLQEVVSETRNFAGSPDFSVAGNSVRDLNAAIVFLNPRIQGMVEDAGRLFGRDGVKPAAAAWTALGASVGLPAAYLWYRNNSPENKADYAQVSDEEKYRYAMIPRYDENGKPLRFTNDRGQVVREYYRIPLRDTGQSFYQMVQASLDFAESKDPERVKQFGVELTENLSPLNIQGNNARERAESVISSFGPVGNIPYMLASQRIPGLHRDIMSEEEAKATPENQFRSTTPEIYKTMANLAPQWVADPLRSPMMLEQLASASGGGIISQFTPPKPTPGRDETATALQQSPLGRRFVRSTYVNEPAPEAAKEAIRGQADVRVQERRTGSQLFDELKQLPVEQRRARAQALPEADRDALRSEVERRQKRPSNEEMGLIRQMGVENGVRANYLFRRMSELPVADRRQFFTDLEKSKLISDDVKKQINFLLQAQQAGRN